MTDIQFVNGRTIAGRINAFIVGRSSETVEDILDDAQLLYNNDELSEQDYQYLLDCLSYEIEGGY